MRARGSVKVGGKKKFSKTTHQINSAENTKMSNAPASKDLKFAKSCKERLDVRFKFIVTYKQLQEYLVQSWKDFLNR